MLVLPNRSEAPVIRETRLRLKADVLIEPVVNDWYAWSYLVHPATAAMIMTGLHIPIIESFLRNPRLHADAQRRLRGGPYIAHDADKAPQVRALLERMGERAAVLADLSLAIRRLNDLLVAEAHGDSLEALYARVPSLLKGRVELFYDERHQPGFRFFESLLYRAPLYDESLQALVLSQGSTDGRSFALSTPRLSGTRAAVRVALPFRDDAIDALSRARLQPVTLSLLDPLLDALPAEDKDGFMEQFFVEAGAASAPVRRPQAIEVTYINHATVLVRTAQCSVLTDPLLPHARDTGGLSYGDLPEFIDYVVLTHNHQDHVVLETLLQLRHRVGQILVPRGPLGSLLDPNLKMILEHCGFADVREMSEFEELAIPGGRIRGVPFLGEHGDLAIATKLAYVIEICGKRLFFGADLNNIQPETFEHVQREMGSIDALFIGMECDGAPMSWLYGPLLLRPMSRRSDQSRRLNGSDCAKAMQLVRTLQARRVFVYAMGAEPWIRFLSGIEYDESSRPIVESNRLIADCTAQGIPCERLYRPKTVSL